MALEKKDIHELRKHFKELSEEDKKNNFELEEIDGLTLLTYKVYLSEVSHFDYIEQMLEQYDQSIVENVDGVYKIDQYKEMEGVTNKLFVQDGFRHIDVNGRTYYYNVLPYFSKNGHMHFVTDEEYSNKYFNTLANLSDEEYAKRKKSIDKKFMKHTKLKYTIDPILDGFILELIAVVKERETGA